MTTVAQSLRIVPGFAPAEFDHLAALLTPSLEARLTRYTPDQVEMELSVKDRDTDKQRVVLEAWLAQGARTKFVATSTRPDLDAAVLEVRDDLVTQINKHLTKAESRRKR
ncbi:HPF/RaiA family ribosome-associated protein [Nocardioides limicola]|uniref:HPF/RaiA family ribosome-associated protein n=1 Tax=Nocardioides limicola TaxID=2803368 RepID=UPI00193C5B10|nr:HPF/RaiA family ribosome-associated protein [Nocardioides sp. DJM-14]